MEYVDVHLATPYGVSDHLLIPVYNQPTTTSSSQASCELAVSPGAAIVLTTTKTKTGGWKVNEFFQGNSDRITIQAPRSFAAPEGAELRCTLRDNANDNTVATFSVPAPTFQSADHDYVFTGADLRNFVGDTSRPATDKTLRGAIKPYIDYLGSTPNEAGLPNVACNLTLSAEMIAGQQVIPINGSISVAIRRQDQPDEQPTP